MISICTTSIAFFFVRTLVQYDTRFLQSTQNNKANFSVDAFQHHLIRVSIRNLSCVVKLWTKLLVGFVLTTKRPTLILFLGLTDVDEPNLEVIHQCYNHMCLNCFPQQCPSSYWQATATTKCRYCILEVVSFRKNHLLVLQKMLLEIDHDISLELFIKILLAPFIVG